MSCYICGKGLGKFHHTFVCNEPDVDRNFYVHFGECYDKFCDDLDDIVESVKPIKDRFEILDL